MGQFLVEKPALPGSALSGNQHIALHSAKPITSSEGYDELRESQADEITPQYISLQDFRQFIKLSRNEVLNAKPTRTAIWLTDIVCRGSANGYMPRRAMRD
jgi:hypothetical protein